MDPGDVGNRQQARRLMLKLDVDEIEHRHLERASCEEIFAPASGSTRKATVQRRHSMSFAPSYGDPTNRRIYMMSRDVEGRWLDLHQRETGARKPID